MGSQDDHTVSCDAGAVTFRGGQIKAAFEPMRAAKANANAADAARFAAEAARAESLAFRTDGRRALADRVADAEAAADEAVAHVLGSASAYARVWLDALDEDAYRTATRLYSDLSRIAYPSGLPRLGPVKGGGVRVSPRDLRSETGAGQRVTHGTAAGASPSHAANSSSGSGSTKSGPT